VYDVWEGVYMVCGRWRLYCEMGGAMIPGVLLRMKDYCLGWLRFHLLGIDRLAMGGVH
jgi:hypothetical protein